MERQFTLLLPLRLFLHLLLLLRSLDTEAGMKNVFGVVGSSVLLDPEYEADLSNSDIIWEFTASNKSPVTILDYVPNGQKEEPNKHFKSRLHFNASNGSLMLNNFKPSDQGVYTITVDTQVPRRIDLRLTAGKKNVFGVVGSSVLLDPEYEADLSNSDILWLFNGSNKSLVTILDYVPNGQKEEPNKHFKSRLYFNASNGCLMLNNFKPSDQGIYTITVDAQVLRRIDLRLTEPLSEPLIISNSTYVDTTVELICHVPVGKASSIQWRKDDEVITNGQRYELVQNNSKLIISKANKSDCGIYTCTVENPVSEKNNSYSLSLYSLTQMHHCTMGLYIATLITAGIATLIKTISCFVDCINKISHQFLQHVLQALQFAPMLSFISLFAASVCWIWAEGCSRIKVFVLVLSCLLIILTTLPAFSRMTCAPKWLKKILSTKLCRAILGAVTPLGEITVICASGILLAEVMKQADKGCDPAINLQSTIILAVMGPLVLLVASFAVYIVYTKWKKWTTRALPTYPSVNDPDEFHCIELNSAPPLPVKNNLQSRTTATSEEQPSISDHCYQ
ncbi:uncharacterized protein [Heptranchias perlo]|uniref:uncharacterized protein n=1 Tax=Heptranchias perlo TaxID=212740 RepID=UPI00355AA8CD